MMIVSMTNMIKSLPMIVDDIRWLLKERKRVKALVRSKMIVFNEPGEDIVDHYEHHRITLH